MKKGTYKYCYTPPLMMSQEMSQKIKIRVHGNTLAGNYYAGGTSLWILCHGLGSTKDHPAITGVAKTLYAKGESVFRFDFSGHGKSKGRESIHNEQHVQELGKVMQYFNNKHKEIFLGGTSFSAFLTVIASLHYKPTGLLTINGIFNPRTFWIAYSFYAFQSYFSQHKRKQITYYHQQYHPEKLTVPVLVMHGSQDTIVPVQQSKEFYDLLNCKKQFKILNDANHYLTHKKNVLEVVSTALSWKRTLP